MLFANKISHELIFAFIVFLYACSYNAKTNTIKNESDIYENSQINDDYFINDIVFDIEKKKLLKTNLIIDPKVVFIEEKFTLNVSKSDLIEDLKLNSREVDEDFYKIYDIAINYINSTDNLTFEYIWTKADDFENLGWFELERLGARNLTKKLLKETICSLIEKGNFEIYQNGKKENYYYLERVNSDYGGNVKGVFTSNRRLIWICPPFIMD